MRYRTIDIRIWGDEKFRSLTPLQPSGQALFLYLLTNPHTTSIPGFYRAGAAAMAEELRWSLEDFKKALEEMIAQGLVQADVEARVVYIPKALQYNKPQSPNVVKSWASQWDEIPECALKKLAHKEMKAFLEGLGKGFREAFEQAINKASRKAMANQEQEQEQEQDQDQKQEKISSLREDSISYADTAAAQPIVLKSQCPHEKVVELYHEILPMCRPQRMWNKTRRGYLKQRWDENVKHQALDFWRDYFAHVKQSKFLTGQVSGRDGKPPFVADLEWLIRPSNFAKVIEGKYHEVKP